MGGGSGVGGDLVLEAGMRRKLRTAAGSGGRDVRLDARLTAVFAGLFLGPATYSGSMAVLFRGSGGLEF